MSKKDNVKELKETIRVLKAELSNVRILKLQLAQLHQTRTDQVDDLLAKIGELMADHADSLTLCVKVEHEHGGYER